MPNTARWTAWMAMVRQSDSTLVQLATMAVLAVLIWESLSQVPQPWQDRARSAYLLGLLLMFLYFTGGTMSNNIVFAVLAGIVMFIVGGVLAVRNARRPNPSEPAPISVDEPEGDDAPLA